MVSRFRAEKASGLGFVEFRAWGVGFARVRVWAYKVWG